MNKIRTITLYETGAIGGGFRCKVESAWNVKHEPGLKTIGKGRTPHEAYQNALLKRVVKPWLISEASAKP